jgi:hypothetical protein
MPINVAQYPTLTIGIIGTDKLLVGFSKPMLIQYYGGSSYADAQAVANDYVNNYMYTNWYGKSSDKKEKVLQKNIVEIGNRNKIIFPNVDFSNLINLNGEFQEIGGSNENVGGDNQKLD